MIAKMNFTAADIIACLCCDPVLAEDCNVCEFFEDESFINRWDMLFGGKPETIVTPGTYLYSYGKVVSDFKYELIPTAVGKDMDGGDIYLYRI